MSATGLEVFCKPPMHGSRKSWRRTGPDRRKAYHALTVCYTLCVTGSLSTTWRNSVPGCRSGSRALTTLEEARWNAASPAASRKSAPRSGEAESIGVLVRLASWYREAAEQESNPMIWEGLLAKAEGLGKGAERISVRVHGSS